MMVKGVKIKLDSDGDFLVAQMVKNLPANARDADLVPGSGIPLGERNGNPLQYSCLGVGDGQGGLACFDSWGCKESDTTEQLI